MPELPEVESVRRSLAHALTGRRIIDVEVLFAGAVQGDTAETFRNRLLQETFSDVVRHGKYLVFTFSSGLRMSMHLRMTGRAVIMRSKDEVDPYCRVRFLLDDGGELRFSDVRKFGRLSLIEDPKVDPVRLFRLGPEPLTGQFTVAALAGALRGTISVKGALLDQRRVAGLGNIYVDESLFRAGIHPARPVASLSREEVERLHTAIETVLQESLEHGGTTFRNYVQGDGRPGGFAAHLRVYGRAGEECTLCGGVLQRERVAGRGTTFCSNCQR